MAKHVYLLVPEGLKFSDLPVEQQAAINKIFGSYTMPMPYSFAVNGLVICDAQTDDSFDPSLMATYGITWEIIGLEQWDGEAENTTIIIPLDVAKYTERLRPIPIIDSEGVLIGTKPRGPSQINLWEGWPDNGLSSQFTEEEFDANHD